MNDDLEAMLGDLEHPKPASAFPTRMPEVEDVEPEQPAPPPRPFSYMVTYVVSVEGHQMTDRAFCRTAVRLNTPQAIMSIERDISTQVWGAPDAVRATNIVELVD